MPATDASPIAVEAADLLPGQTRATFVGDEAVLLCNVEGVYYAVANRCSHAGEPLGGGRLRDCLLQCPVHGAKFDVRDGSVALGPARRPIAAYPVVMAGDKVEIRLATPAAT